MGSVRGFAATGSGPESPAPDVTPDVSDVSALGPLTDGVGNVRQ